MTNLWLDDCRPAPDGWTWCKTVPEAMILLATDKVFQASLDHDLGLHMPTGYDLCLWMAETGHWPNITPYVHSNNAMYSGKMSRLIWRYFGTKQGEPK